MRRGSGVATINDRSAVLVSSYSKETILGAVLRPGPFWFNGLAPLLARHRWCRLQTGCGIDRSNYGTARLLERNHAFERNIVGYLRPPGAETRQRIMVECLQPNLTERYRDMELEFYTAEQIAELNLFTMLNRAFDA